MKRWITLIAVLLALTLAGPTLAQGGETPIAYGDAVEGEITGAQFEVAYRFSGAAGDVVHIRLIPDESGELYEPSLILLDAENSLLTSVEGWYEAELLTALPADGDYILLASRTGGRTGESAGKYMLTLNQVANLAAAGPVEGEMTNEETRLYAVPADVPFTLEFERLSGDFSPELTINVLTDYGDLELVSTLYGSNIRKSTLVIEPDPEQPADYYYIQLAMSSWDWSYEPASSHYRLTYTP